MKITLEFNDDDEFAAKCAIRSCDLWLALSDIDDALRNRYKHEDISDEEATFIETLREETRIIDEFNE